MEVNYEYISVSKDDKNNCINKLIEVLKKELPKEAQNVRSYQHVLNECLKSIDVLPLDVIETTKIISF